MARLASTALLVAALAFAHHSTAIYDLVHGTIVTGVVTRFDWENPHVHIALDVTGENNELEHWAVEAESPSTLVRLGWNKQVLKPGDHITVTGGRAKDNTFRIRALWVELSSGRRLPGQALPQY
jgi:uncharacterized protein DUF6152